tara:strand:+ start:2053 stop:2445 length:393 start_codon:yes stop_codon:yes gene_type:complete
MEPKVWGSHAWIFLHTITLNYPDEPTKFDKENYKNFFENLSHVIPCEVCKSHYKQNIKKYPIQLESKETLTRWLHKIHNIVNVKNGIEEFSYDEFIKKYSDMYSNNSKTKLLIPILIIILCLVLFYIYKK